MKDKEIISFLDTEQGKRQAFRKILKDNKERVYFTIRRLVFVHEDADDLTQEVFIKVWQKIGNFRGQSSVSTWIHRIAINHTLNFIEKQKRRPFGKNTLDIADFHQLEASMSPDASTVQLAFQKALATLPPKQLLVFNLRYFDELSYEQISSITSTSVGALKSSYHHAVKKIQSRIQNI